MDFVSREGKVLDLKSTHFTSMSKRHLMFLQETRLRSASVGHPQSARPQVRTFKLNYIFC